MTDILCLDDKMDKQWAEMIYSYCGLNLRDDRDKLTKDLLNKNLKEIISGIFYRLDDPDTEHSDVINYYGDYDYTDWVLIGFQILGAYILKTGARLPSVVKYAVLFSTEWDYDKWRGWSRLLEKDRKKYLNEFREAILNYKEGKPYKVTGI